VEILIGFILGLFLGPYVQNYIFYKFIWSPIKIHSDFYESISPKETKIQTNCRVFKDTITIKNNSPYNVRIKRISISVKSLEKNKKIKRFSKAIHSNESGVEKFLNFSDRKYGETTKEIGLFPFDLESQQTKKIWFGVISPANLKSNIETKITVSIESEYKKSKLIYHKIIFRPFQEKK